ncbi:MAG: dienelactone hydrolase family protein [Exilibacterium sp.]
MYRISGLVHREVVQSFEQEMQTAGADYEVVSFPGIKHSFTNPDADQFAQRFDMPLAYDQAADQESWQGM